MSKIGDECSLKLLEIIKLSIDNKHSSELESSQSISQVVVECNVAAGGWGRLRSGDDDSDGTNIGGAQRAARIIGHQGG